MKNRLSFSSVEKYLLCPKAWFLYYLCGIREKFTSSALVFGGAFDKGLNILLSTGYLDPELDTYEIFKSDEEKFRVSKDIFLKNMNSFKLNGKEVDLETTPFVTYGSEDFDFDILTKEDLEILIDKGDEQDLKNLHLKLLELKKAKKLKGSELKAFNYISWISLKRKGLLFLEAYKEQVLPQLKRIIAVQKEIVITNDDGDEFVFYIDLIAEMLDGRIVIFDNKTSGTPYKEDSVLTSKQLASYLGAIEESTNPNDLSCKDLQIDYNNLYQGYIVVNKKIRKKKEPKVNIQIIIDKVPSDVVDSVYQDYDMVNEAIHEGIFPAKPETCRGFFGKCFCSLSKEQIVDISINWRK